MTFSGNDFDFWLGSWRVTDGATGAAGTNELTRTLGGKVIEERFTFPGPDGQPYLGVSHTVLVPDRGWCQTWVDNQGLYLDFEGGIIDGVPTLSRGAHVDGVDVLQRMTFSDITPDSLVWQWWRTAAGTVDWIVQWRLDYTRIG